MTRSMCGNGTGYGGRRDVRYCQRIELEVNPSNKLGLPIRRHMVILKTTVLDEDWIAKKI